MKNDLISRQAAIDMMDKYIAGFDAIDANFLDGLKTAKQLIKNLPSAQPTLCGYNMEHLELIARVLQRENLPPERITEVLTDIGRIVAIVRDEFEETLRKAVEQCTI